MLHLKMETLYDVIKINKISWKSSTDTAVRVSQLIIFQSGPEHWQFAGGRPSANNLIKLKQISYCGNVLPRHQMEESFI